MQLSKIAPFMQALSFEVGLPSAVTCQISPKSLFHNPQMLESDRNYTILC